MMNVPSDPDGSDPDGMEDDHDIMDSKQNTEGTVKELFEKIKYKGPSEVRGFINQIPKDIYRRIFPDDITRTTDFVWVDLPDTLDLPTDLSTIDSITEFLPAACRKGDIETVKLLLFLGMNPTSKGEEGSPLEVATLNNHIDIIDLLIKCKPDLVKDIPQVKRCLAKACHSGHRDLVSFWLERLKSASSHRRLSSADFVAENDPLIAACKGGHPEVADRLLADNVFVVNKETVTHGGGEELAKCLEIWVDMDDEPQEQTQNNNICLKTLAAKWANKHLHTFEPVWLQLPKYEGTLINIDLSHNSLRTIPGVLLWGLPWLRKLTLSHNNITRLPAPGVKKQLEDSSLTFLTLANNLLNEAPSELFLLQHLKTLSLAHNKIRNIQLANIELRLDHNDEDGIAWRCHSLQHLDLSNNQLERIPTGIKAAKQLTKLCIATNGLTEIPQPWYCPLEKLNASNNKISRVPDIHLYWQKSLRFLNLSENKLTMIPLSISMLSGLHNLNLSHNQIQALPPAVGWCTSHLSYLDLSHNALLHIKSECGQDPYSLNPTVSPKSSLTDALRKLSDSLHRGKTGSDPQQDQTNTVFYVPVEDEDPAVLSAELKLEFPTVLNYCLCTLDLSHNKLQGFPDSICDMKTLQVLNIKGNPELKQLPVKLCTLPDLFSIKLDPEQITEPSEIAQALTEGNQSSLSIKQVLRQRLHNSKPYRGMKLMIVGPEKSGKTSLLTYMTGCDFPEEDRGINVMEWSLPNPAAKTGTLNPLMKRKKSSAGQITMDSINFTLWDLKGEDSYTMIHQTLFTSRTLYLVVWDVTEKETGVMKLKPWIQNIKSTACESCIIAVGTHVDMLPKSVKRQDIIDNLTQSIYQLYPEIAECVWTESGSLPRSGVSKMNNVIYTQALKMEYLDMKPLKEKGLIVGRKVPQSYIVLRDLLAIQLKQMQSSMPFRTPIMTEAEFNKHLRTIPDSHLMTTDEADAAVRFLRDTGSVTHVSDHTYQLTNLYFLDPAWLCDVLLAVVKFKHTNVQSQEGMVLKVDLKKLCAESGFGEHRFEEYLQLLGRFEIALAVTENRCLIPALLPRRKPVVEQTNSRLFEHKIQRLYKMAYIPPGFWSRLVSRVMVSVKQREEEELHKSFLSAKRFSVDSRFLLESQNTTLVWQEGISVTHENGQILLEPMTFPDGNPGIKVAVRNRRPDFKDLGFVVDHIESLIKEWYPGLDESDELVQRFVPCPLCERRVAANESPYGISDIFATCNVFAFKDLAAVATLLGAVHKSCSKHPDEEISLKEVVPDVLLADLGIAVLDMSQLTIGQKLGQGGFGVVHKANYKGRAVAVKRMLIDRLQEKQVTKDPEITDNDILAVMESLPVLRSELAIMSQLNDHPCVLKLIGVSIHNMCFAMEFAPLGDLASFVREQYIMTRPIMLTQRVLLETILPRMLTYKIALQITAAIAYLHKRKVIHTDLKTDNILLFSEDTEDLVNVKLADYGISHNLVAGGVRGNAGGHAFCAPEITKGKAFDEKADLFSLGMLLYHIMSGVLPFDRQENSIQTKINIVTGSRPKFENKEYSVCPNFAHLEGLMRQCWKDSPTDRPSAEEVLDDMQKPGFLCLRQSVEVESDSEACLYTQQSAGIQREDDETFTMWLWRNNHQARCVTAFNFDYNTADQAMKMTEEWPGGTVLCAIQFGDYHVLGTKSEKLEVYKYNSQERRFTHQTDLKVPTKIPATSLHYQPLTDKESEDVLGRLFVGFEDGSLLIYSHHASTAETTPMSQCWKLQKSLLLNVEYLPCLCMHMMEHIDELLIGCGNTIRILSLTELLLDTQKLVVAPTEKQNVQGMVHYGNMVWCFVRDSCYIAQYDIAKRQLINRFHCSGVFERRGQCLSNPIVPNQRDDSYSNVTAHALPLSPSSLSLSSSFKENQHSTASRPKSMESSVMRMHFALGRTRSKSTGSRDSFTQNVSSLLTVKDTLWIGRTNGDILVVGIDPECSACKYGEVLTVFSPNAKLGITSGPVTELFLVGLDRVVACRDIIPEDTPITQLQGRPLEPSTPNKRMGKIYNLKPSPYKHQFLVWEDWGIRELRQFERTHEVLH